MGKILLEVLALTDQELQSLYKQIWRDDLELKDVKTDV